MQAQLASYTPTVMVHSQPEVARSSFRLLEKTPTGTDNSQKEGISPTRRTVTSLRGISSRSHPLLPSRMGIPALVLPATSPDLPSSPGNFCPEPLPGARTHARVPTRTGAHTHGCPHARVPTHTPGGQDGRGSPCREDKRLPPTGKRGCVSLRSEPGLGETEAGGFAPGARPSPPPRPQSWPGGRDHTSAASAHSGGRARSRAAAHPGARGLSGLGVPREGPPRRLVAAWGRRTRIPEFGQGQVQRKPFHLPAPLDLAESAVPGRQADSAPACLSATTALFALTSFLPSVCLCKGKKATPGEQNNDSKETGTCAMFMVVISGALLRF